MPWGAAVDTNGLKSCVTLFSGELSMTSVAPVVLVGAELLDEQAASPAARSTAAASASALLLDIRLNSQLRLSSRGYSPLTVLPRTFSEGGLFISGGCLLVLVVSRGPAVVQRKARPRVTGGPSHCSAGNPLRLCWLCYEAALRCSRTYSSVPEPGPLLVPDGWHESYGFDLGRPAGVVRRGVLAPLGRGRRRDDRQLGGDVGLDRGEVRGLLGDRLVAVQLVQVRGHRRVVQLLVVTVAGTDQRRAEPAVVEVERGDAAAAPAEQQRKEPLAASAS